MTGFKVTAVGAGKATIKVTTSDGGFTDKCDVTVKAPAPKWALFMFMIFAVLFIIFSNRDNQQGKNPQESPQQPIQQQQRPPQPPQQQQRQQQPQQQRPSHPPQQQQEWILRLPQQQQRPQQQQEWIIRLPQQQRPIFTGIVTGDRVNIRSWPAIEATSLGMVNKGFKVEVIEEGREWHKIQYLDDNNIRNEGYISAQYVMREGSAVPPYVRVYSHPSTLPTQPIGRNGSDEESKRQQTEKFIEETLRLLGISPNS